MSSREDQVKAAIAHIILPPGISIRPWTEADFPAIQRLSAAEGWPTPNERSDDALTSWRNAWPALVSTGGETVIGFVRALSDGAVTMYVAELLVDPAYRGKGLGRALLDACHHLHPTVRFDLLSTASSEPFYEANGFRRFQGFRKSYR